MTMDRETLLMAYVDGELDATAAAEIEALLAADPLARRHVEAYRETTALLRAACAETFYPPLHASSGPTPASAHPTRRMVGQAAWLVAASVLLAAGGFGGGVLWGGRRSPGQVQAQAQEGLLDEIARYQAVYARETVHLVEVPAAQTEHLKAWLGNRLDRRLVVPDLTADGLRFAGGRMLVSGEKPMAQLMYTREAGPPVALCIAQMPGSAAPLRVVQRGGMQLAIWEDGRYAYVVAGDVSPAAVRTIAENAEAQIGT